jgi:hypothetical protein
MNLMVFAPAPFRAYGNDAIHNVGRLQEPVLVRDYDSIAHFRLRHVGLWTESFIFFGDGKKPDLTNSYLLDWGRPSFPSIYEHT